MVHTDRPSFGLISDPPQSSELGAPYGIATPYFRDLIERAANEGWTAYVFSTRDVLKQRRVIWGWTRAQGRWQRSFFSVPQIGYPRMRRAEESDYAILDWLHVSCGTQFINQIEIERMTADRWRLLQICLSHPALSKRVADSFLLRDQVSLEGLLAEYPALIAMSRFETSGTKLACIRSGDDQWVVELERNGKVSTEEFHSIVRLRVFLVEHFGETVLQPHKEPLRIDNCPVALRSFWQRGADTRWQETAALVRVGQPAAIGSTLATAGLLDRFLPLIKQQLTTGSQSLAYQLKTTAQTAVELLDHRGHGAAELAIDFSLHADGTFTLRSASTLGGYLALQKLNDPALRHSALNNTLGYASALQRQVFAPTEATAVTPQSADNS